MTMIISECSLMLLTMFASFYFWVFFVDVVVAAFVVLALTSSGERNVHEIGTRLLGVIIFASLCHAFYGDDFMRDSEVIAAIRESMNIFKFHCLKVLILTNARLLNSHTLVFILRQF